MVILIVSAPVSGWKGSDHLTVQKNRWMVSYQPDSPLSCFIIVPLLLLHLFFTIRPTIDDPHMT